MKSNAPKNYVCPICLSIEGIENDDTLLKQADQIFRDDLVSVWINSFWVKGNEGHVIVVPNEHFETIYEVPKKVGNRIFEISKLLASNIKNAYKCDGITLRQNNEPAGDQHAFHYHQHIFPRYEGDQFNHEMTKESFLSAPEDRIKYVEKLKTILQK